MDATILKALNAERRGRRAVIAVTDLADGSTRLVREGESVAGPLCEAVSKTFRTGNSATVEADGRSFFLNAHLPQPRLVVIGAVHISQALAPMARIAGYPGVACRLRIIPARRSGLPRALKVTVDGRAVTGKAVDGGWEADKTPGAGAVEIAWD